MRSFERGAIRVPGHPNQPGYVIRCSKCDAHDNVITNTHSGSMPPEGLATKFRNKGWIVAQREGHDVCPKCQQKKKLDKATTNVVPMSLPETPMVVVEPPREMGREDRRLIFAKIDEVYLDERTGYSPGWTDKRVAEDLGVPLAWVQTLREENFGTEGIGEAAAALIKEIADACAKMQAEAAALDRAIKQSEHARDMLYARYNDLMRRDEELKRAAGLQGAA